MASVQRRAGSICLVLFALLALAGIRALYLGTVHSGALRQDAAAEHATVESVPAARGTITDRKGVVLAVSEPADEVSAEPYLVKDPLEASKALAPLLGQSASEVLAKLSQQTTFVYLAKDVPAAQAKQISELQMQGKPIEGIEETPTMRRVYPRGTLASQVLGELGGEGAGLSGLEYSENSLLKGVEGQRTTISDARGEPISITDSRQQTAGKSIRLTIDANIQHRAEEVLGAVGSVFKPASATAIVMNPQTGGLLAVANWPSVNANDPASATASELQDKAVSFLFEPGSTFKVVTFSGALEEGLITPETNFQVPDQIEIEGTTIHDAEEHPVETLTAAEILARSSNVGTIKIGGLLGPDRFNEWVHRWGFGAPTGVDLPGEERGEVISPSQYSGVSMGNLPIGQGEGVTPMQIVTAYAAVANGGILRPPHIVARVGGKRTPIPAGRRVIKSKTAAEMRKMMEGVLAPGGTASEVSVPGYKLAGKTGTANKVNPETGGYSETAFVGSFVGFAPARHPKLVCAVIVNEPQTGSVYGGTVAAPAFGQIMAFALPYLGIPPE
ncbi:MAG: peptidoglycan D,D-transpeptidase FtsI family protein [Solirubrobacteraceae bacterium]